jgi:hypothetical protein
MSKLTKYTLNKYVKAIEILAYPKFGKFECIPNKGSKYSFRLYEKPTDQVPCQIWGIHVDRNRKKVCFCAKRYRYEDLQHPPAH